MIAVYYFSGAGHSRALANWVANFIKVPVWEIGTEPFQKTETAVVVFPVYCQNLPRPVKDFLRMVDARYVVLIASYGGISPGNVLQRAARSVRGTVIAAAAVPTGHSFLAQPAREEYAALLPLCDRIHHPKKAEIPKLFQNPFAGFFPSWRSRMGVAISRTPACDNCKICEISCPQQALHDGTPNHTCIRCLRCVSLCPRHALQFSVRAMTKRYLHKQRDDRWYIFL